MQGKTVVITGGTSGIGEIARLPHSRRAAKLGRHKERQESQLPRNPPRYDKNAGADLTASFTQASDEGRSPRAASANPD